jgi:hypothetical protein
MFDGLLGGLVALLALVGGLALARRLFGALGRAVLSAAEMAAASGSADVGARRGDLTAMAEGKEAERRAGASRRRSLAAAAAYVTWLVVPLVLGGAAEAYAVAAPLWLLPSAPVARTPNRSRDDPQDAAR